MDPNTLPQDAPMTPEQLAATAPDRKPKVKQSDKDMMASRYHKILKAAGVYYEQNFVRRADRMSHLYEVEHYRDDRNSLKDREGDRIKVAYPYSNVRQIIAEVYSSPPDPIVKPNKRTVSDPQTGEPIDTQNVAEMKKNALNYVIRKSDLDRQAKIAILDGLSTGVGCIEIAAQKTTLVPKYSRRMYREILWDCANVLDVYDSEWVACKLVRPLDDIKADETYDKAARNQVQAAKRENSKGVTEDDGIDYGVLWNVYDKKNDVFLVLADGQDLVLDLQILSERYNFKTRSDDFKSDWPFVFFIVEEKLLSSFGMGFIYPIESQVRELDKTRSQQVNHRKRFNRKYVVEEGTMDAKGFNQLKNPDDGTIIEVKSGRGGGITPLSDAPMSADVYKIDQIVQNDIQIISPLGPNSLTHGVGQSPATLGEAKLVSESSNTRLGDTQRVIANGFKRLYRLTDQFIEQYWTDEMDLLVNGDGSKQSDWAVYDPSQIQGEYDYDVVPESMKDNTALYRRQMAEATQIVAPLLPALAQSQGLGILLRKYLKTFETLSDDDVEMIVPEMQPQQPGGLTPAHQDLMNLIQGGDTQQIIDSMKNLPDNERSILQAEIQKITGGMQTPQPQSPVA